MCVKAVDTFPFYLILFLINIRLQKYCLDKYKTQRMCDKVVDDFLLALVRYK